MRRRSASPPPITLTSVFWSLGRWPAVEELAATVPQATTFVGLAGATVGPFGATKSGPGSIVLRPPGFLISGTADKVVATPARSVRTDVTPLPAS